MSEYRSVSRFLSGAPDWVDDWIDFCTDNVRAAITSQIRVPSQRHLENLFPAWWSERQKLFVEIERAPSTWTQDSERLNRSDDE